MNALPSSIRRSGVAALALGALGAVGVAASVATAQQSTSSSRNRTVTVRVDSANPMKVVLVLDGLDSLVRSLAKSRALEERIGMALREYGATSVNVARRMALEEQLQKIAQSNLQLMSKIQLACTNRKTTEHAPDGYLGVTFNISGSVKREGNGPEVYHFEEPPEIISVETGSPAERAGMRRGDRILALGGQDVVGRDVVLSSLLVPGRKLPVRLAREGGEPTVTVLVQKRPEGFGDECTDLDLSFSPMRPAISGMHATQSPRAFTFVRPSAPATPSPSAPVAPPAPPAPAVWTFDAPPPVAISGYSSIVAGAQLTTLTDDFKDITGADAGLLVQRVLPELPAAAAGLRGGDVIVEASGRPVLNARMLQRMIGDSDDRSLKLKVVRKGKARTVWLRW